MLDDRVSLAILRQRSVAATDPLVSNQKVNECKRALLVKLRALLE
jgi:hypothetical protein